MKDIEISKYLKRLKLNDCNNSLEDLISLQQGHMVNIPFENLDVIARRNINLDGDHLYHKIITNRRGGYCFELNTLYSLLLKALGFLPKPVLGRVWLRNPEQTPPRNHLAHLVQISGETFITDVGFGGLTTRVPLNINDPSEINDNDGLVRILKLSDYQFMIQRKIDDDWANQYSFENVEISTEDIYISNYYMSTNPRSHFYNDNFIGKFTSNGRIGLFNNQLTERNGIKIVSKKRIEYGIEWLNILSNDFNLKLNFSNVEFDKIFDKG
ncbi:arylamine N-acetyltransferase family protein [Aquimarina algicola]|uniref:Arylamine N-acetyltransferase n=1 Tax=Aquimarina algicola TaxID=2589995 RepID=A0A504J3B3_9FLAO|nr:arylamine N-acetyltransferase [Aquimarina algicola]TPN82912.1 arylamine N-acetyltransferase [Aquimarina algicola]